jgi:hypothetical protein
LIDASKALAQIKEKQLYRIDYTSFEEYCRQRWGFQHSKAYRLITIATICEALALNPDLPPPEQECQVLPLIGQPSEMAAAIWQTAYGFSNGRRITPVLVRRAMRFIGAGRKAVPSPAQREARASKRDQILSGLKDLLKMVGERASTAEILHKIQAIGHLVECAFAQKQRKSALSKK